MWKSGVTFARRCFRDVRINIKVKKCKAQELKQSEPKSNPQNQNGKNTIKYYNETMKRVHGCKYQHFKPKLTKLRVVGSCRVQLKIKLLSGAESSQSNIVNYTWYFISTVVNQTDPQNNKLLIRQHSSTISILRQPLSKHPLPSLRAP